MAVENVRKKIALKLGYQQQPPPIHFIKSSPIKGIAENKFVITVAPQKDICSQGST
jgi:hypothetical protein